MPALADVILIHGTGSSAVMWQSQVDALTASGRRCFLPELRGHGDTRELGEATDLETHLQDVLETLEQSTIKFPAVWIGHSLGAIIALSLAQRRPDLFDKIFAVGMPGKILAPVTFAFRLFLKYPYKMLKGTALHRRLAWRERTLLSTDYFTLHQIVENFAKMDYLSKPLAVSCPVHFLVGRWDPVAPFFYVKRMHKALPNSTLKILEMAGHNCMDTHPKGFNEWILRNLT